MPNDKLTAELIKAAAFEMAKADAEEHCMPHPKSLETLEDAGRAYYLMLAEVAAKVFAP